MAPERHNPAKEFDTMFRRHLKQHLKQGGAPVAPCVGFDADTASAYLERALDGSTHTQFESHLAGCAACRRQLVGLARLHHEIESLIAKSPIALAEPVWPRWYGAVAQWFDFSGWNQGWAVAATACGLLLVVFAAATWRQMTAPQQQATEMIAANLAPGGTASSQTGGLQAAEPPKAGQEPDSTVGKSTAPQAELHGTPPTGAGLLAVAADKQLERRSALPPLVTPPEITLNNNLTAVMRQLEVKSAVPDLNNPNFGTQPLPPPPPGAPATAVVFGPGRQNLALPIGFGGAQPRHASSQITLQPNELEKKEIMAELVLPAPSRAREAEAKEKPANDPIAAARSRELAKALKGRALSLAPLKDDDSRTKEADSKEVREQSKPMMQRLNGHTLYFEHGYWIDEEYKSDTTMPLIRLTRGSARYQQILIENPTLEQFFKLGPVIVIWKGKVYEVGK